METLPSSLPVYLFARVYNQTEPVWSTEDVLLLEELSKINLHGPKSWGAAYWLCLHLFSVLKVPMYPSEAQRLSLTSLLQTFWPEFIPCEECSRHWKENTKDIYDYTENGTLLFKRLADMHNWVNIHAKQISPLSYVDVARALQNPDGIMEGIKSGMGNTSSFLLIEKNGPVTKEINLFGLVPTTIALIAALLAAMTLLVITLRSNYSLRQGLLRAEGELRKAK